MVRPILLNAALAQQGEELAPRLRPVGLEMGLRVLEIGLPLPCHLVAGGVALDLGRSKAVDPRGVQAEDLRPQGGGDLGVAVALPERGGGLERPERLDLVLRRAVPDRVGPPEDVIGAAGADQLAKRVRGLFRLAHQVAPGAAELGINVRTGSYAV